GHIRTRRRRLAQKAIAPIPDALPGGMLSIGSWRAPFRFFFACIGTMNRGGSLGDDMSIGRQALEALHLPITMKTNSTVNTSQADGEQVVRAKKYQVIKLGVDWHAEHYRVVRMIDGAGPEPAQRFS